MKKLFVIILLLLLMLIALFAETNRKVVGISIAALHPRAIELKKPATILSVMDKGVHTMKGSALSPPMTLINHAAIINHHKPDISRVTDNLFRAP